jgi:hypothetical protein
MKIGDKVKCISVWSPHGTSEYEILFNINLNEVI